MAYLGDYTEDYATLNVKFTTRKDTGLPTTLSGTPAVSVYKANSLTQSTAGITLTADFDAVTGLNNVLIDLSADAFYAVANDYAIVITTGTVNSISVVGEVVATFSIENRFAEVNVTKWLGTAAATPTVAGVPEVDITHLMGTILAEGAGGRLAAAFIKLFDVVTPTLVASDVMRGTDSVDTTAMRGTDSAALASVCTEARLTELDAGNLITDVFTVRVLCDDILVDTGTTLDTKINDIQGATFSSATDSLEAVRDRGDAAWTTGAGGSDRLLMVDTTIATLASQTSFTLTAGSADNDAYNNCTIVIEDVSTATQKAVGLVVDYVGSTKTVTLKYDPAIFTIATTDKVYILAENALKSTASNRQLDVTATGAAGIDWGNIENKNTANDLSGTDIQLCDTVTTNTDVRGTDSAALASVCTEVRLATLTDWINGGRLDLLLDAIPTTAMRGTDSAALASVCTEVRLATLTDWINGGRLDLLLDAIPTTAMRGTDSAATAANLATVDTVVDAILVDTAVIGALGAGLTGLGGMSSTMKAQVNTEVDTALATTTYAEPGQETPGATVSLATKISYLYKMLRNRKNQTATLHQLFADNATTVDQKSIVSSDGTTAEIGEMATGA